MAIENSWVSGALHSQLRLAASTLLTRLPVSMMPLGLLLLVVTQTGSYTLAGLAAGAHVAGCAVANPVITRRYAQIGFFRPLLACSIAYPLLVGVVIALAYSESAWWLVVPAAAAAGTVLPVTHQVLAGAWRRLAEEHAQPQGSSSPSSVDVDPAGDGDHRAALWTRVANTVVADSGALLGPLLVTVVVIGSSAGYAVGIAALAALVGSWLLITDPHAAAVKLVDPHQDASQITRVASAESRSHQITALLLSGGAALAGSGVLVAAVVGFAREETGRPALAGIFLALWVIGGFVGGVSFGSMLPSADAQTRYRWMLTWAVLAHLPLIFIDRTVVLVVLLPLAGGFAAASAAAYAVAVGAVATRVGARDARSRVARAGYLGFGIGLALGGAALGLFADTWSAFAVCAVTLLVALLAGVFGPWITLWWRDRNPRPAGAHSRRH